ncbi:MAG: pyruvate dehydrogenase complex dihydrolipoamide acetyltransferase [Ktedonobacteraceae bacterium]
MSEVNMPRLSDTMQEGTIAHWLKKSGDEVKKGDILAEIETDKATMDLEAYDAGVLEQILVQEGETVPIGQAIAVIGTGAAAQKQEQPASVAGRPGLPEGQLSDIRIEPTEVRPTADQSAQQQNTSEQRARPASEGSSDGRSVKASPLARRLAEEHNIDLSQIQGTGPNGRIVRDDIEDVLEQKTSTNNAPAPSTPPAAPTQTPPQQVPAAAAPTPASPEVEVVPLSRVQGIIARRLTESKQTIPHFYVSSEIDMTEVLALRQSFNASAGENGMKVTVNDLIVKACALALEKFPEVNSSFKENQCIRYKRINVGIAVDVPSGLVVPVIHDANVKGVRSIAREAKALIEKARNNKLAPIDLEGGTFSVSNLGMMDVTSFLAVINPPQSAILAVASTQKRFVPIDGQPVVRDLMPVTLSADHRILYGAAVARFLQEVKRLLQTPYNLLG